MATRTLLDDLYDTAVGAGQLGLGTAIRTAATPAQVGAQFVDAGRRGLATVLGGQVTDPTAIQQRVRPEAGLLESGSARAGQGLAGLRQRALAGIGATPRAATTATPATPATPAALPATAAATPASAGTPSVLDLEAPDISIGYPLGDWGRAPATAPTVPAAPVRQTRFDITNTPAAQGPMFRGDATPIPASLQAPQWGAGVQPQTELSALQRPGGGQVITLGSRPELDPTNRNFNPVAARFALRQNQLDTARANALTEAQARMAVADISGQYGLQERSLANQGALAGIQAQGGFGLQERTLANQGSLATTDLAGQYSLAAAQARAQADYERAVIAARAAQNDPQNLLRQRQLQFVDELSRTTDPGRRRELLQLIQNTRSGQSAAPQVVEDFGGPAFTVDSVGGITPLRSNPVLEQMRLWEEARDRLANQ